MRRDLEERHQTTTLSSAEEKALMNQVKIPSLCSDVMFLLFCTAHCTHIALLSCLSLHAPHFKTPRILQPLSLSHTHTYTTPCCAYNNHTHTHTLSLSLSLSLSFSLFLSPFNNYGCCSLVLRLFANMTGSSPNVQRWKICAAIHWK